MRWLLQADDILLVTIAWLGWRDLKDKRELLRFFHARKLWSGPLASSRCMMFVFPDNAYTNTSGQDGHKLASELQQIERLGNCTAAILTSPLRPLSGLDDVVRYVFANLPNGVQFLGQPWTEEYVLFLLPTMTFINDPLPIISRSFASILRGDYDDHDGDNDDGSGKQSNMQQGAVDLLMADILTINRSTPVCGYNILILSKSLVISSHTSSSLAMSHNITWCEHIYKYISSSPLSNSSGSQVHLGVPKELNLDFAFDIKHQEAMWDDVAGVMWSPANVSEVALVHFDSVTGPEIDIVNFPHPNATDDRMLFYNCDFQTYGMWDVVAYATHPVVQRYLSLLNTSEKVRPTLPKPTKP